MITIQIDEVVLKQDWQTTKQALQILETMDAKYGGSLGKTIDGLKQNFKKVMQDGAESQIIQDFRSQLGL